MKYRVTYEQDVILTFEAIVEADSEEEAMSKIEEGIFESEEEIDHQGVDIRAIDAEELED